MTPDFKHFRPAFLQGKLLSTDNIKPRTCRMCPTRLTFQRYYCSSMCVEKAKTNGTYGREEEVAQQ